MTLTSCGHNPDTLAGSSTITAVVALDLEQADLLGILALG